VQRDEAPSAKLGISPDEARHVANLLRYAISLNTAVGLVRAERRLSSSTYRAVELAARVLEGKTPSKRPPKRRPTPGRAPWKRTTAAPSTSSRPSAKP